MKKMKQWGNSLRHYKQVKGFTLIELIVVMAIIAILVLLAAPRFLGRTNDARVTQIKNDIRVAEDKIADILIREKAHFDAWEDADELLLSEFIESEELFGRGGLIHEIEPGMYKVIDDEFIHNEVNSPLDGDFFASDEGTVYHYAPNMRGVIENGDSADIPDDIDSPYRHMGSGHHEIVATDASYFEYDILEDDTIRITGYSDEGPRNVVIPETIDEKDVSTIGSVAFAWKNMTGVIFPDTVTIIGSQAFDDNQLSSVVFPNDMVTVAHSAFRDNLVEQVTFPEGVTYISSNVFQNNNLTEVHILGDVDNILNNAFTGNQIDEVENVALADVSINAFDTGVRFLEAKELEDGTVEIVRYHGSTEQEPRPYYIPDDIRGKPVTLIASNAFQSRNLTAVNIPDTVTRIGSQAFQGNNLSTIVLPDGLESIWHNAFRDNKLTRITIPNKITNIGGGTFRNNALIEVVLPDNLESIDSLAFAENNIDHVDMPAFVDVHFAAFDEGVSYLETKLLEDGSAEIVKLHGRSDGPSQSYDIPDTLNGAPVTSISSAAFAWRNLTDVKIPDTVTRIGQQAFEYNPLSSVYIPDSVESIGRLAFRDTLLETVEVPSHTYIGEGSAILSPFDSHVTVTIRE